MAYLKIGSAYMKIGGAYMVIGSGGGITPSQPGSPAAIADSSNFDLTGDGFLIARIATDNGTSPTLPGTWTLVDLETGIDISAPGDGYFAVYAHAYTGPVDETDFDFGGLGVGLGTGLTHLWSVSHAASVSGSMTVYAGTGNSVGATPTAGDIHMLIAAFGTLTNRTGLTQHQAFIMWSTIETWSADFDAANPEAVLASVVLTI